MNTEIRDTESTIDKHTLGLDLDRVVFLARNGAKITVAAMRRADFLFAVETECHVRLVAADAIVIERAELPEVTETGTAQGIHGPVARLRADGRCGYADASATDYRRGALATLALAEYLDAHPPVPPVSDEDVETLAGVLSNLRPLLGSDNDTIARRLLATGKVTVTT